RCGTGGHEGRPYGPTSGFLIRTAPFTFHNPPAGGTKRLSLNESAFFASQATLNAEIPSKKERGGSAMEDGVIVELYWQRDQRAIGASEEKYGGLCRSLSWSILQSREDAEECVNDTWHRAWTTMPPQRPGSLRAYLVRSVRNLSIDRYRARRSQKR